MSYYFYIIEANGFINNNIGSYRAMTCSLVRSAVSWRIMVMAKLCLATIAGCPWPPSGAFVIVHRIAKRIAKRNTGCRTNMSAVQRFLAGDATS